jgi:hypothetical protein
LFCCGQVAASLEELLPELFLKLRKERKEILLERDVETV